MKSLATSLIADGQQISDDELILYIHGGLGPEFESVIVNLTSIESVTLQEVRYMPQTHEMRLESLNTTTMVELSHLTAHFVHKQFSPTLHFRRSQRGRYNRGGGGRFSSNGGRSYNIKNTSNKPVSNFWKKLAIQLQIFFTDLIFKIKIGLNFRSLHLLFLKKNPQYQFSKIKHTLLLQLL